MKKLSLFLFTVLLTCCAGRGEEAKYAITIAGNDEPTLKLTAAVLRERIESVSDSRPYLEYDTDNNYTAHLTTSLPYATVQLLLTAPGHLGFYRVYDPERDLGWPADTLTYLPEAAADSAVAACRQMTGHRLPLDALVLKGRATGTPPEGEKRYDIFILHEGSLLDQRHIESAMASIGRPYNSIDLWFDHEGARLWERVTGDNIGRRLAIVMDDFVVMAPVVRMPIEGGRCSVVNDLSLDEIIAWVAILNSGPLPLPVQATKIE